MSGIARVMIEELLDAASVYFAVSLAMLKAAFRNPLALLLDIAGFVPEVAS